MRFAATGRWSTRLRGLQLKRRVQFILAGGCYILPVIAVITTAEVAETSITTAEVAETFYAETLIIVAISPGIVAVWFLESPPLFTHTH
jgi:hypothetical protein